MVATFPNGVVIVFAFFEVSTYTDRCSGAVILKPSIFVLGPRHACSLLPTTECNLATSYFGLMCGSLLHIRSVPIISHKRTPRATYDTNRTPPLLVSTSWIKDSHAYPAVPRARQYSNVVSYRSTNHEESGGYHFQECHTGCMQEKN